eukprot:TRINITY_DN88677_c0_g1_i1.p1 TRINITY_DN88677_c0_g1~~TRINITY_DN88677_c0_g1_i1.p1  ORF type:complete len:396 (+),score=51.32 TRINITY_DN88677_c0_g1_i1:81-1268(+)
MGEPASIKEAAKDLAARIAANKDESPKVRRALFGQFAKLRNAAEASQTEEAVAILDEQRQKLRLQKPKQSMADKVSMYIRLVLAGVFALFGAFCVVVFVPLRMTHPMLKRMGIPSRAYPLNFLARHWALSVMAAAGINVKISGATADWVDKTDLVGIIVYNHTSNLDPFLINSVCGGLIPKYIGKKVLFHLPILGWLFACFGIPLNRGDREKAVKTMNEAVANSMLKSQTSVCISPEGTRTTDGHLRLPFKKGVFHVQEQTKVPLLPIVIQGAYELWPPGQVFTSPGEVTVSFLPAQFQKEEEKGCSSRDATRVALQQSYADALSKLPVDKESSPLSWLAVGVDVGYLIVVAVVFRVVIRFLGMLTGALGLGTAGVSSLFLFTSLAMSFYVEKIL